MTNLKKVFICLMILLSINTSAYPQFNIELNVEAQETAVSFFPGTGYLNIYEYNLSSTRPSLPEIEEDIRAIKKLAQAADYCDHKYKFAYFESIMESMGLQKGIVTAACNLITTPRNGPEHLEDILEKILDRDVAVKIDEEWISVVFAGDDINVAQNNALGVFESEGDTMIRWPNAVESLEVVVHHATKTDYKSIGDKFGEPALSPEITKEQLQALIMEKLANE